MARQETVTLIDDLDGSEAAETVAFSIDNRSYEIDLSADNAANLRKGLADYIERARKVPGRQGRGARTPRANTDRERNTIIRQWARENGHTISDRGRIPQEILIRYEAAH